MPRSPERLARRAASAARVVALVVDRTDWHARKLTKAFAAARGVRARFEACGLRDHRRKAHPGSTSPGFGDRLPDAVLVRSMSGGTFEAVTLRLGILHALREIGVLVWNDARAIERCVDKSMTSFLLARAGIPTPATWAVETHAAAQAIVAARVPTGAVGAQAAVRLAGPRPKLIRDAGRSAAAATRSRASTICSVMSASSGDGFRDFRLLVSRGRVDRRHDAARCRLDHQRETRRPAA